MTKTCRGDLTTQSFTAVLILVLSVAIPVAMCAEVKPEEVTMYNIKMTIDGAVLTASLDDSPTVQDFVARLPLTLVFKDYAATEKVGFLSEKLTMQGAPPGSTPVVGDISYYAPWGNLAIFYQKFSYSPQLIRLGRITSNIEHLNFSGEKVVTITLIQPIEYSRIKQ